MSAVEQTPCETHNGSAPSIVHLIAENPDVAICGALLRGTILEGDGPIDCVVCAELVEAYIGRRWPA